MAKQPTNPYAAAHAEIRKKSRGGKASAGTKAPPELATAERMVRAQEGGGVVSYDERAGSPTYGQQKIDAAPLERLHRKGLLAFAKNDDWQNERFYQAGKQFRNDWFVARLNGYNGPSFEPRAGGEFNPLAPGPLDASSVADARKRFANAKRALGQTLGQTVEQIVCDEADPDSAVVCDHGQRYRQTAGIDRLRNGLERLAEHYEEQRGARRRA